MDTNGDGLLSKQELVEAYTRIMSMEEATYVAEKVMWCVDLNGDGYVDFSEFMLAAKNHQSLMTSINIRSIFLQLDSDNSGKISFAEFKAALNRQKLQADDQMWETIVKEVDADGDRELSLKEFSKLMLAAVDMGTRLKRSFQ
jgi:calcium-dependent protein kinase